MQACCTLQHSCIVTIYFFSLSHNPKQQLRVTTLLSCFRVQSCLPHVFGYHMSFPIIRLSSTVMLIFMSHINDLRRSLTHISFLYVLLSSHVFSYVLHRSITFYCLLLSSRMFQLVLFRLQIQLGGQSYRHQEMTDISHVSYQRGHRLSIKDLMFTCLKSQNLQTHLHRFPTTTFIYIANLYKYNSYTGIYFVPSTANLSGSLIYFIDDFQQTQMRYQRPQRSSLSPTYIFFTFTPYYIPNLRIDHPAGKFSP